MSRNISGVIWALLPEARHASKFDDDDVVYWYSIQYPLHHSGYASLGRVCTVRKVRTIRGCLEGLALMI